MIQPKERLVFFDLETAGLKHDAAIIQIAAIAVDSNLNELDSFEQKIRFDESKASPEALAVNSFEPTIWKRLAEHPEKAAANFAKWLRPHATVDMVSKAGKPYQVARLAAHNAAFDGPRIIDWYQRMGMFLPAARNVFCTLQRAYWLFEEEKQLCKPVNFKLETLCEYCGIPFSQADAHDALADVRATVELYRRMYEQTYFEPEDDAQAAA